MSRLAGKLLWYARRAAVMSPGELAMRSCRAVATAVDGLRYLSGGWRRLGVGAAPDGFAFCRAEAPMLPRLPWEFSPTEAEAESLIAGEWPALGFEWRFDDTPAAWHTAPDTGRQWPRRFAPLIAYRAGNPVGDARVVWEPSRLQQLVALALLEDRPSAVATLERALRSWVAANPPLKGVHYVSAMECALRIVAVCHALDMVRGRLGDGPRTWQAALDLVLPHAGLIAKRTSVHSSRGNHTVAEAAGLIYAGLLFQEFASAAKWLAQGTALLAEEAEREVLADGGGIEQAFWYHLFVLDLFGLCATLLESRSRPVPQPVSEALARGREFLNRLAESPAGLPDIGDRDDGHALSPYLRLGWRDTVARAPGLATIRDSGYSLFRLGHDGATLGVFDHGPLGMAPSFGHGHADALSLTLGDWLIDPGTGSYTGDAAARAYFRGTAAHNTVEVDGADQARQASPFQWTEPYSCTVVRSDGDAGYVVARHDGYDKRGVRHWRCVAFRPPAHILVWDLLSGTGAHEARLHWHCGGEARAVGDSYLLKADGGICTVRITGATAVEMVRGTADMSGGWRAPVYGKWLPTPTLRASWHGPLPHEFHTWITLGDAGDDDAAARFERVIEAVRAEIANGALP